MGLKRSSHQDPTSEDETNNPTHSMSSVDLDVDETGEEGIGSGHDTQESPETVVRAKFAFTGEGEDEVGVVMYVCVIATQKNCYNYFCCFINF